MRLLTPSLLLAALCLSCGLVAGQNAHVIVSKVPPRQVDGILWYNPLNGQVKAWLNHQWQDIYLSGDEISAEWIGAGTVSNSEFGQLDAGNWDSQTIKNWVLGQIAIGGAARLNYAPLGSWADWVGNQTLNGFWITVQHWTDSSYWYLAPDTTAMWLSDSIFAGNDTVLYADFEDAIRSSKTQVQVAAINFSSEDTVLATHNLGTRQVALQIWQNDSTETWPNEAAIVDDNNVQVVFLSELSGKVLVMGLRQ